MAPFKTGNSLNHAVSTILLAVLLSLWVGGAVAHYCFDGLEPPVTVHFDNLKGHIDHEDEGRHMDTEKQVFSDNLISKLLDPSHLLVTTFLFLLLVLTRVGTVVIFHPAPAQPRQPSFYQPPLRAPPQHS